MRGFIFTTVAVAMIAAPAVCAQGPEQPKATPHNLDKASPAASGTPEAGLSINDCLIILQGLNGLDLHQVVLNQGKPNEQIANLPYEFGSARLRLDIGRNIAELGAVQRAAQATQEKITAEIGKGEEIKPGSKEATERDNQIRELLNQPCRAHLEHIKAEQLRLEKNEIPSSILAALDKILDR